MWGVTGVERRLKLERRSQRCCNAYVPDEQVQDAVKQRRGLRRRWIFLLPAVFVTYSLAYLGRSNFGFGAATGLAASLNITESRAAFLGSVFFLGYFLFQVPAAAYATRKSATRLVFFCAHQLRRPVCAYRQLARRISCPVHFAHAGGRNRLPAADREAGKQSMRETAASLRVGRA